MRSQKNRFWRGLAIGGVVGGVIALLLAPKSGQEIRRDIRKKADALKDEAERKMQRLRKDGRLLLVRTRKALAKEDAV
jgi:gas vesicle protein